MYNFWNCATNSPNITLLINMLYGYHDSRIGENINSYSISDALQTVGKQRLFFGHQSVGGNILDGIRAHQKAQSTPLNLIETRTPSLFSGPALFHCKIGKNMAPQSKIQDFAALVEQELRGSVSIACFKLCYVDITRGSDISSIINMYQRTMTMLMKNNPDIKFIHITVPLTTIPSDIAQYLYKFTGKCSDSFWDNKKRNEYNQHLRDLYQDREPIFDLARHESTRPVNGAIMKTRCNNHEVSSMIPEYTEDGGHLNDIAKFNIASKFIKFLAKI